VERFRLRDLEARGLSDFLTKCMAWEPKERWTAAQLLDHYWLKMIPNYNTHMSRAELREYKRTNHMECSPSPDSGDDSNVDQLSDSGFSDNAQTGRAPQKKKKQKPEIEEGPIEEELK